MSYYMRVFSVRSVPTDGDDPDDWDLGEHKIVNAPVDTIAPVELVADDLSAAEKQAKALWKSRFHDSDAVDGYWIYGADGKLLATEFPHISEILDACNGNIRNRSQG